ncbi:hypothetical protein A2U01_0098128, partial [Trifolium medium]|nr:hypothetical protein [Trifolium medium]
MKSNDEPEVE